MIEIALAAGDIDAARSVCLELEEIRGGLKECPHEFRAGRDPTEDRPLLWRDVGPGSTTRDFTRDS